MPGRMAEAQWRRRPSAVWEQGYLSQSFLNLGATQMAGRIPAANVKLKRAYEPHTSEDGTRILVERLWPRGIKKEDAAIDLWDREIAPSTELRKWFGHDPARWQEFCRRYAKEVDQHAEELGKLRGMARQGPITLVFSAHDEIHNNAVVLRDLILSRQVKAR